MQHEPQINCTNAYDINLDASSSGLTLNGSIYLLSTVQLLLSERMASSEVCTLYDRKNQTNPYNFLQIKRVRALDSSVSFKPIFVDFTLLIDMLPLWQF